MGGAPPPQHQKAFLLLPLSHLCSTAFKETVLWPSPEQPFLPCSSSAPSLLPPSSWGHPWPSPHHHGHRASRSHILHLPARVTFGPWAALRSWLPLQRNKEKHKERRRPGQR